MIKKRFLWVSICILFIIITVVLVIFNLNKRKTISCNTFVNLGQKVNCDFSVVFSDKKTLGMLVKGDKLIKKGDAVYWQVKRIDKSNGSVIDDKLLLGTGDVKNFILIQNKTNELYTSTENLVYLKSVNMKNFRDWYKSKRLGNKELFVIGERDGNGNLINTNIYYYDP